MLQKACHVLLQSYLFYKQLLWFSLKQLYCDSTELRLILTEMYTIDKAYLILEELIGLSSLVKKISLENGIKNFLASD